MSQPPVLPREGELEFDFGSCPWRKIDGEFTIQGMRLVDFIVEEEDRTLLIEVKDPGQEDAILSERDKWQMDGHIRNKIETNIVPKARDTYCYLHLMQETDRPIDLIFLLGYDEPDANLRIGVLPHLKKRLRQEGPAPWKRPYIRESFFLRLEDFSRVCPSFSVRRV